MHQRDSRKPFRHLGEGVVFRPTTTEILRNSCEQHASNMPDLQGRSHQPNAILARWLAVGALRAWTMMSYPSIAEAMDRVNHSGVLAMHNGWLGLAEEVRIARLSELRRRIEQKRAGRRGALAPRRREAAHQTLEKARVSP